MSGVVFRDGVIIDGTGEPGYRGDVVVEGGHIVAVGDVGRVGDGCEERDLGGLAIAPGFIDSHSHADNAPFLPDADLSKLTQGVTTEIVGNCGFSLAPRTTHHSDELSRYLGRLFPPTTSWSGTSFGDLLEATDRAGYIVNYAPLIGHGTVRIAEMGFAQMAPTERQLAHMRTMVEEALDAGAIGLSSGLTYAPGASSDTAELIELARVLRGRPALYTSHVRSEGRERLEAVDEAILIGRDAGVRVQISHHKAMGRAQWGGVTTTLGAAERARQQGVDVRFDVYPYTASSTMLTICLPPELGALESDALSEALARPETAEMLAEALARGDWNNHVLDCGGFDGIRIASTKDHRFEGQTLAEIAQDGGLSGVEAIITVLREEDLQASMVCFAMSEADVHTALGDPLTSVGSDGLPPGVPGKPHPRMWGTFPRVLGRYVREQGVLGLEQAVHRMTELPAETFRLPAVGRLAAGYASDIVIFDPAEVEDGATYDEPCTAAKGIVEVMIGGTTVLRDGRYGGARCGRRLRSATGST